MHRSRTLFLATSALIPLGLTPAPANPLGAQVVGGSATVQGQGTAKVTITQQTNSAIINWNTFNIGTGEKTNIIMPTSSSVQLDRVTGGLGPSQILGSLSSNGRVFLVNPDGILFGAGAKIDTGGFLATTHDIANADFMAGRYNFTISGNPSASVVNQGMITAQSGGFAALVAPGVRNSGTITANLGTVTLASGNGFTLDFYGDKLITLGISDSIAAQVKDVATGQALSSLVSNEGKLKANGGRVELTAVAARKVVDSVINNKGIIEANTFHKQAGMVVLGGPTSATKVAGAPTQTIKVSGKISAAGKKKGTKGGTIQITGENVQLANATLDAAGRSGGGTVLIGGDVGGGNPNPLVASIPHAQLQAGPVPTATNVTIDAATTINASAISSGDGGKVVVWADSNTAFAGAITATGGAAVGSGGFVETSGHQLLAFTGKVDTKAPSGRNGTLLLDPQDVTIGTSGTWIVTPTALQTALASGDVIVTNTSGTSNGDITVAEAVSWSNSSALTLNANRNIAVNANITNTGGAAVTLRADDTGTGVGTVSFASGIIVSTSGTVSIFFNPSVNPVGSVVNSTSYENLIEDYSSNVAGGGILTAYMLVNTVYDLQNIANNLSGTYALGTNIDASSTSSNPFSYIGTSGIPFIGTFEGNGFVIDQPTVGMGLFSYVGSAGIIRNVGITNGTAVVHAGVDPAVGLLVGKNAGIVINSFATGTVNANTGGASGGGLVGWNTGSIANSHAAVSVQGATGNGPDGGLVGFNDTTGTIAQSSATGAVSGLVSFRPTWAGGFVGWNKGTITQSYATGNVTGTFQGQVGGFVAVNDGTISQSYAKGNVSGGSNDTVGGFAGFNDGRISESYSVGSPTETSPGVSYLGGFVGYNSGGTYTNDYWDTQTSGLLVASRNTFVAGGVTGLATANLKSGLPNGFNSAVWALSGTINNGYPYLQWQTASTPSTPTTTLSGGAPAAPTPSTTQPSLPPGTPPFDTGQTNFFTQGFNTTVADSTLSALPVTYTITPTPESLLQSSLLAASGGTPPQWLINDVKNTYRLNPQDIQTIADNAQYAQLANAAYASGSLPPSAEFTLIGGEETATGMSASVFRNDRTGEVVVSFRGTVSDLDWNTNFQLVTGVNINNIPEMQSALTFAESIQEKYGKVTFTGHSLGGAMAQYAAMQLGTSARAITFDPAPISLSLLAAQANVSVVPTIGTPSAAEIVALLMAKLPDSSNIINFRGSNDPLTSIVQTAIAAPPIGRATVTVQNTPSVPTWAEAVLGWSGVKTDHNMDSLALAMGAVHLIAPSILSRQDQQ